MIPYEVAGTYGNGYATANASTVCITMNADRYHLIFPADNAEPCVRLRTLKSQKPHLDLHLHLRMGPIPNIPSLVGTEHKGHATTRVPKVPEVKSEMSRRAGQMSDQLGRDLLMPRGKT